MKTFRNNYGTALTKTWSAKEKAGLVSSDKRISLIATAKHS
jgi:hypothetical protein